MKLHYDWISRFQSNWDNREENVHFCPHLREEANQKIQCSCGFDTSSECLNRFSVPLLPGVRKRQVTPSNWIFDFDGDQISESRNYFDMLTFLKQIGAA